jgi:hypothetical protein
MPLADIYFLRQFSVRVEWVIPATPHGDFRST